MPALRASRDAGFSLIELLGALALTMVVTGAATGFIHHASSAASAQPAAADVHQRARVAADVLFRDLVQAGAGIESDAAAGSLARFLPPVMPRRIGLRGADTADTARADVVTVLSVPAGSPQSRLSAPLGAGSSMLMLTAQAQCATGRPLCGLVASDTALAVNPSGHFGLFELLSVGPGAGQTRELDAAPAHAFQPGDHVAASRVRVYYHDAARRQLRAYDANQSDLPVVDDVGGLSGSVAGDPAPPSWPRPEPGTANCLYDDSGAAIPGLVDLRVPGGGSIVPLPLGLFRDGPWCGQGGLRYDVDLMRVRRVMIEVRLQAGRDALRGTGTAYAVAGTSTSGLRAAPDFALHFDVAPVNLQVVR